MLILSPQDVLDRGLKYLKLDRQHNQSKERKVQQFQQHYGSSPLVIACIWYDIQTTHLPIPEHECCPTKVKDWVRVEEKEKSEANQEEEKKQSPEEEQKESAEEEK